MPPPPMVSYSPLSQNMDNNSERMEAEMGNARGSPGSSIVAAATPPSSSDPEFWSGSVNVMRSQASEARLNLGVGPVVPSPVNTTPVSVLIRAGDRESRLDLPPLPPTPSSNFEIMIPEVSSDSDGSTAHDDDLEDIFPSGVDLGSGGTRFRELISRRLEEGRSVQSSQSLRSDDGRSVSDIASLVGSDGGNFHEAEIRTRRQLLEGRAGDNLKDVVICVIWAGGKFAAASYDLDTGQLFILPDIAEHPPYFDTLRSVMRQISPSYVLVNKSSDERFSKAVLEITGQTIEDVTAAEVDVAPTPQASVHVFQLASKEFAPVTCKKRVQDLKLPFEPKGSSAQEHVMFISSLIPLNNDNMVRAAGCLLKFLDKSAVELFQIELVGGHVPVTDVKLSKMDDIVLIEESAWQSLQIFSVDVHPSSFKQGVSSSTKEGLSVYGLLSQRCTTNLGKKRLRLMLLQPTRNLDILQERYDVIDFLMDQDQAEFLKSIVDCLKFVKNIPKLLYRLSLFSATAVEWKELYQSLYYCLLIGYSCASCETAPAFFKNICQLDFITVLRDITQEMNRIIDFDQSITLGRIASRPGLDPTLDRKKKQLSCLGDILSDVADEELRDLPPYATRCSSIYIPEVGYLLGVTLWRNDLTDEDLVIPNLDFRFRSHDLAYYKSCRTRELDVILGDCSISILEMETGIMVQLAEMILERSSTVQTIGGLIYELDCLIAMSSIAKGKFVRPAIVPSGSSETLKIIKGRHPLSEMINCDFVPNSTIFNGSERMVIITGPNCSGKSVYMKQVAVIVIMALSGSFVPADYAQIPLFDKIFTRIHTVESISSGFSSFLTDLNQISLALNAAGKQSLIMVDEFGKGTSEMDGLSILAASIQEFVNRGNSCPMLFLSTHFHSLPKYLIPSPFLKYQSMKFMEQDDSITYLFELTDGLCDKSLALEVSKAIGFSGDVLSRMAEVGQRLQSNKGKISRRSNNSKVVKEKRFREVGREFLKMNLADETTNTTRWLASVKRRLDIEDEEFR